jgi:hypothetical protein
MPPERLIHRILSTFTRFIILSANGHNLLSFIIQTWIVLLTGSGFTSSLPMTSPTPWAADVSTSLPCCSTVSDSLRWGCKLGLDSSYWTACWVSNSDTGLSYGNKNKYCLNTCIGLYQSTIRRWWKKNKHVYARNCSNVTNAPVSLLTESRLLHDAHLCSQLAMNLALIKAVWLCSYMGAVKFIHNLNSNQTNPPKKKNKKKK